MAITTSTELQSALSGWLNRTDFSTRYADFIALVEARFNRKLRVRAMETAFPSATLASGAASLPDDFLAFKELRYDGEPTYTLEPRPLEWVANQHSSSARPLYYAVKDAEVLCWPTSGDVLGTYYASIPSLNDTASNWLLTTHPDLYLFACLSEAGLYMRDATLMQTAGARAESLLEEVNGADKANALNGGPLTARAR